MGLISSQFKLNESAFVHFRDGYSVIGMGQECTIGYFAF